MRNIQLSYLKPAAFLATCLLFAGAYYQAPLFSYNQNTYFLSGLTHAGYGYLSADWLANQTDHIPIFSSIISLAHAHGSHWVFYILFCGLVTVYAASLSAIVAHLYGSVWRARQMTVFLALLTLLHCTWVLNLPAELIPGLWHIIPTFQKLAQLSTNGVAGQYILGSHPYLQPSAFGVLLVTSVACFLYKREFAGVLCAVVAATIHPTYILHASILTAAYMIILVTERHTGKAMTVGALAAILILPIILYTALVLHPSSSLLFSEAQAILVEERIPHHAKVSVWFSKSSCIQVAIVLAGIMVCYRSKRLCLVITLCAVASISLTFLQVISNNRSLALCFPWRLSAWLVPISTAILLGYISVGIVSTIDRFTPPRLVQSVSVSIICLSFTFLAGSGFFGAKRTISTALAERHDDVVAYVKANSSPSQTYLVPLEYETFRLASGLPIFVDWKSHPYRDCEVLEWHDRIQLANAFYQAETSDDAARALETIQRRALVTHIIVEIRKEYLLDTLPVQPLFRGSQHVVVKVTGLPAGSPPVLALCSRSTGFDVQMGGSILHLDGGDGHR